MGQIVKGKKKGRPSKADLARRAAILAPAAAPSVEENDRRRSLRRRNVRYNNFIDYDDYLDEFEDFFEEEGAEPQDEEEEEEEALRKEKKLKLVLNLHEQNQGRVENRRNRKRGRTQRMFHTRVSEPRGRIVSEEEDEEDEDEEEEERERDGKPSQSVKKRGIYGSEDEVVPCRNDEEEEEDVEEYGRNNGNEDDDDEDDLERSGRKRDHIRGDDSIPGTPYDSTKQLPLPDKKTLELILDKLQKKDIYGVYAEPVDLEELPDYLDVIDHPMDFATVRKKLSNGSYEFMEQFESDVFLICSNAMQYNSSDTIYYKQARTIQELATKKFLKLRVKTERSDRAEKEIKSDQKTKSNLLLRKQGKKALSRPLQEPVGSDFSSGATLATQAENQNGYVPVNGYEKSTNVDTPLENSFVVDNLTERVEELSSGKGGISRFGRKPATLEDRRSTYNMPHHSTVASESVLATFDSEIKQLVAVGLHADHAYSRSLARFAATLGPVAWKVASPRIELALPSGYKYGRGWVGEYEPLPTPILILEARQQSEPAYFPKVPFPSDSKDVTKQTLAPVQEQALIAQTNLKPSLVLPSTRLESSCKALPQTSYRSIPSGSNTKSSSHPQLSPNNLSEANGKKSLLPNSTRPSADLNTPVKCFPGMKNSAFSSPSNLQNSQTGRNFLDIPKIQKLVELNLPPPCPYNDDATETQRISKFDLAPTKLRECSGTQGPPNHLNALVSRKPEGVGVSPRDLPNGKVGSLSRKLTNLPSDANLNNVSPAATFFPHGHDHGLTDPVEAMRISTQKAQNRQSCSNMSFPDSTAEATALSVRSDSCSAAASAARAWMSIGAGNHETSTDNSFASKSQFSVESLYNPVRSQLRPQISRPQDQLPVPPALQGPAETNDLPFQAFIPPAPRVRDGMQSQSRPMIFPHLVSTDLARFQMQFPWRGLGQQTHQKQKPDTLPPDLNIGFQSPGSPVKQSSTVMSDSQQPDLALQL